MGRDSMEKRFYLDGKCILSYDTDVYDEDEYRINIMEFLIDPIRDQVYKKYYEKPLIRQVFEQVFKKNDEVFRTYCDIKSLIENEEICAEDIEDDDTLLKKLMIEKLDFDVIKIFEELLKEARDIAVDKENDILCDNNSMGEHFRIEYSTDNT